MWCHHSEVVLPLTLILSEQILSQRVVCVWRSVTSTRAAAWLFMSGTSVSRTNVGQFGALEVRGGDLRCAGVRLPGDSLSSPADFLPAHFDFEIFGLRTDKYTGTGFVYRPGLGYNADRWVLQ